MKAKYPERAGWDIIRVGNRTLAINRWGGAVEVIERRELQDTGITYPKSWELKERYRR